MKQYEESGHGKLWGWFSLSYASFLTLPRVLMHEMPDEWQGRMADLLNEFSEAYENFPPIAFRVQATDLSGKFIKTPEWMSRAAYRHPCNYRAEIDAVKTAAENGD